MIRALIFDFDGLILDTEVSSLRSWQEIYQEHCCELPLEKWVLCIGGGIDLFDPCDYLETLLGRAIEREEVLAKRRKRHLEMSGAMAALPGVEGYIDEAKRLGLKVGVASSSSRIWVSGHLRRLGLLDHFDSMWCGDEVTRKKPHPELYLSVLEELGVRAEEVIALEDSPNGVRAAQRAGIFCVVVPNSITGQLSLDHADMRLSSLLDMELVDLIAEVENKKKERAELWD